IVNARSGTTHALPVAAQSGLYIEGRGEVHAGHTRLEWRGKSRRDIEQGHPEDETTKAVHKPDSGTSTPHAQAHLGLEDGRYWQLAICHRRFRLSRSPFPRAESCTDPRSPRTGRRAARFGVPRSSESGRGLPHSKTLTRPREIPSRGIVLINARKIPLTIF